jgi:hypothetical protein
MTHQHNPLQHKAARRHAVPNLAPTPGLPLIKSTVNLGRRLEWRKARDTVETDMPDELKKRHVYQGFLFFKEWMEKEDRAHYIEGSVRVSGPFPHFNQQMQGVQVGENGATRPIGHRIEQDVGNNGKEDYIIEALFNVPEYINEISTDLAQELFGKGRPGLRPLREQEWRRTGKDAWSLRN